MGLDMYMYRVHKLTEQEAAALNGLHSSEIAKKYHYIDKNSFDDDPEPLADLLPYVTQVSVIDTVFDYNKCFVDHGVSCIYADEYDSFGISDSVVGTDRVVGSWLGPEGAGWSFASGVQINITKQEYESYLYDKISEIYVWKAENVGYWRKFHDFDDFLQEIRVQERAKKYMEEKCCYPSPETAKSWLTENCGYYLLSTEEKERIKIFLAENEAPYSAELEDGCLDDNAAIMYHAWW